MLLSLIESKEMKVTRLTWTNCHAVVDDLLNTFLGVDGRYIHAQVVKRAEGLHLIFTLTTAMDPSIRDLARRLLPLRCDFHLHATSESHISLRALLFVTS